MKTISVQDFLWNPSKTPVAAFCVIFGEELFMKTQAAQTLRTLVLKDEDAEFSFSRFEGKSVSLDAVLKDVSTQSMFGGGRRFVLVEDADPFVTRYRAELENYAEKPSEKAVLLLLMKSFPANTRLFKLLSETGRIIEAKPLDEKSVPKWIERWARHRHGIKCEPDAAAMILHRIGPDHGMLDQELAKLALMTPPEGIVTVELVEKTVGSLWVQSIYQLLNTALLGRTEEALRQLDSLLLAGEKPTTILNRISPTLRTFAKATDMILEAEKHGKRINPLGILAGLGVWKSELEKAEKQLRLLGRHRGAKLYEMLYQADLDLKGGSKMSDRQVLETFLIKLSHPKLRIPQELSQRGPETAAK